MSGDPVAFLNAALDEAEKTALAAKGDGDGVWERDGIPFLDDSRIEDPSRGRVIVYDEGAPTQEEADHIVRHAPAAVLRRIAAERKLIASHQPVHDRTGWNNGDYDDIDPACGTCGSDDDATPWPCGTIKTLAEAWGWTEET